MLANLININQKTYFWFLVSYSIILLCTVAEASIYIKQVLMINVQQNISSELVEVIDFRYKPI